ncbi:unnamed protein product [Linum trigynum]|uniref:Uncharacterized protein n=1 Tax=Linum trigynum TaxID=586398 RepID=A0AAV2EJR8_9ROSI
MSSRSATLLTVVVVAAVAVLCLMSTSAEGLPMPTGVAGAADEAASGAAAKAKELFTKYGRDVSNEALQQTQEATKSSAPHLAAAGPTQQLLGTCCILLLLSFLLYAI